MKTLIIPIFLLAICLAGCSSDELDTKSPDEQPTPEFGTDTERYDIPLSPKSKEVNAVNQQFAFDLFKVVAAEEEENCCVSPLSTSLCIGMILNGADNDTYQEIQETLGYSGFSNQEINEYVQTMQTELPKLDGRTLLTNANSIWINNNYTLLPDYIQLNKTYYDAEVSNIPFDDKAAGTINQWCDEKTNGLIPTIIDHAESSAISYLLNAIYFKGMWTYEFKKDDTTDRPFYTADGRSDKVATMTQENDFNIYRDRDITIVELPYGNQAISMLLFMPSLPETNTVDNLIGTMDHSKWEQWMTGMRKYSFEIRLPRFKMEKEMNLIEPLKALGIQKAFTDEADFTKMCSLAGVSIGMILQKTYLEVNEAGTEAAAVTIGGMSTSTGEPIEFNPWPSVVSFDHPFGYIIRENSTGAILFAGKVAKPQQN